jgi:putative ABC transport system permease protein
VARVERRVFRFPRRSRAEISADIDEEIRTHLDLRAAALERSGLSPAAAMEEARRQFGDVDDAREYCTRMSSERVASRRRSDWLGALSQDIRYAFRQFRREPTVTVGAALVLALGIAAATSSVAIVRAYLLRPLPLPNAERLVSISMSPSRMSTLVPPPGLQILDWNATDSLFDGTVAWDLDGFTLIGGNRSEQVDGAWVSEGFIPVLGIRAAAGRTLLDEDYRSGVQVAMISYALWERRYARSPAAIGSTLRAYSTDRPDRDISATIVGVLPKDLWHFHRFTNVLLPLSGPRVPSLAVLKPSVTRADTERRLTSFVRAQLPGGDPGWRMGLASAHDEYVFAVRPALLAAAFTALGVLLVVCVNLAGLMLTRSMTRTHELNVRAALGAGGGRILRQLMTEALVLAVAAGAIGLLASHGLLRLSANLLEERLRVRIPGGAESLGVDVWAFVFAFLVAILAALLIGALPALLAVRRNVRSGLASSGRAGTTARPVRRLRSVFVVAQIAGSLALVTAAAALGRAAWLMSTASVGFDERNLLKAHLMLPAQRYAEDHQRARALAAVAERVRAVPGVLGATLVAPHPFRLFGTQVVLLEGAPGSDRERPRAVRTFVAGNYLQVMRIPLIAGRMFDERDRPDAAAVVVVSEKLAVRLWQGGTSSIGRRIRIGEDENEPWRTVVGVAGDVQKTFVAENPADVYIPLTQDPSAYVALIARTARDPLAVAENIQRAVWSVDPELPLADVERLEDVRTSHAASHRFIAVTTVALAAFALVLALIGLYATLAYNVGQRARELAIRMAVGADARGAERLIAREGALLILCGIAVGVALSAAATRLVTSHISGVPLLPAQAHVLLTITVCAAALMALVVPARRAGRTNPASLLRD